MHFSENDTEATEDKLLAQNHTGIPQQSQNYNINLLVTLILLPLGHIFLR